MINEYNFKEDQKPEVFTGRKILTRDVGVQWPEGNTSELKKYITDLEEEYSKYISWTLLYEWTGYEDCHYFVRYECWEDDEEMQARIQNEKEDLKDWETIFNKRNAANNSEAKKQKEERRKQFEALKKEFGQ